MAKTQKSVKEAMASYQPAAASKRGGKKSAARKTRGAAREADSALVAEMVIAYIRRGGEIRGDLVDYIERVKAALSF